ncbi:hypothetical protein RFI_18360 [Reticulomyxa filosa]|uniref:ENTH domain-containing protein n=1 Tax=Reticulomyxa filosa TaxID=46433 RepID=X6MZK3_RETFI|nr:hypothetical protein RFI_18360 [Reticulomyxa filosa]|eukprot:ETO18889.1 hypothetical protein RFI_18360 [Reticulomyxa filosa]
MSIGTLVNKATVDNRDQPPGFVLQELATKTLSIEDCRTLENLLLNRLEKNKPYIKYKTLRVIKYLCDHGAPRWKQSWQSHTDKIRACAQFRGPPDAVYGDSPYENVRKAAKEAMDAVFSSTQIDNSKLANRIIGREGPKAAGPSNENQGTFNISAPTSRAPAVSDSSNTRPYAFNQGFGNTDYKPKATVAYQQKQKASYVNPNTFTTEYPHSQGKLDNQISRTSTKRVRGEIGGNWKNETGGQKDFKKKEENSDEDLEQDDNSKSGIGYAISSAKSSNRTTDGSYERQWVNSVITAGGIGDKIPDLKLKLQQFQNLSQSHVLEFLDEKLADNSSWQAQAKALTLIEALLNDTSAHVVAEYFRASPENLQALAQSKKVSLKKKGGAIAHRIGLDAETESEVSHPVTFDGEKRDTNFELDSWMFNETSQNQHQTEPQSQDYTDDKEEDGGMFAGLDIANPTTTTDADDGLLSLGFDTRESTNSNPSYITNANANITSNGNSSFNFISNSNPSSNPTVNFNPTSNPNLFDGLHLNNTVNTQPSTNNFDIFAQIPINNTPSFVNPPMNIPSNANKLYLNDPFANINSQPTQSQQNPKNKKAEKDPFADLALGTLHI